MMYVGVDQHKYFSQAAVVDEAGKVVKESRLDHRDVEGMWKFFRSIPRPCCGVLEATRNWDWLHDMMEEVLDEVKLCNPAATRLIAESKVKTDKVDARILAQLARTGFLAEAYAPPHRVRALRELGRFRRDRVAARTHCKNRIHTLLDRQNIQHEESDLFGMRGRQFLEQLNLGDVYQEELKTLLKTIDYETTNIKQIEKRLLAQVQASRQGRLLLSVPGLGPVLSYTILAEVGEIERFASAEKFARYCGLVGQTRQSASHFYQGRIGRGGNHHLKWAFVEAAHIARKKDPALAALYQRMASKGKPQKGIVAVARHLAVAVYHILKRNEPYRYRTLNGYASGKPGPALAAH